MAIIECGPKCTIEDKNGFNGCGDPIESYAGRVLGTYERNGYDDSDFYAMVWNYETQSVKSVCYASTRGWTYHNKAVVDACPSVLAVVAVWAEDVWLAELTRRAEIERMTPAKGMTVRSLMTRGKNVGVEGTVMWYGEDKYKSTRYATYYTVGIKVVGEDKLRYLPADKVEPISPTPLDHEEIKQRAYYAAANNGIRSAMECSTVSGMMAARV